MTKRDELLKLADNIDASIDTLLEDKGHWISTTHKELLELNTSKGVSAILRALASMEDVDE